jgi:hypothetical protein
VIVLAFGPKDVRSLSHLVSHGVLLMNDVPSPLQSPFSGLTRSLQTPPKTPAWATSQRELSNGHSR